MGQGETRAFVEESKRTSMNHGQKRAGWGSSAGIVRRENGDAPSANLKEMPAVESRANRSPRLIWHKICTSSGGLFPCEPCQELSCPVWPCQAQGEAPRPVWGLKML